jgi:hypothetical protein
MSAGMRKLIATEPQAKRQLLMRTHEQAINSRCMPRTISEANRYFDKWEEFCQARGRSPYPPDMEDTETAQDFEDLFNVYVLHEYNRCHEAGNVYKTFAAACSGVNNVFEALGYPRMNTSYKKQLTTSYKHLHDNEPNKAKPLRPTHLHALVQTAHTYNVPWLTVLMHVIIVMWFCAMRWSDFEYLNMEKTFESIQTARNTIVSGLRMVKVHFTKRKNKIPATSIDICDEAYGSWKINPVDSFLFLFDLLKANRQKATNLCWWFSWKKHNPPATRFLCKTVPIRSINYDQFMKMFKVAQSLAGLSGFTLHSQRRGLVSTLYANAQLCGIREEFIMHRMGVEHATSARGYNEWRIASSGKAFRAAHHLAFANDEADDD